MSNIGTTTISGITSNIAPKLEGAVGGITSQLQNATGIGLNTITSVVPGNISGLAGDTIGAAQAQLGKAKELADKLKNIKKPTIPNFKGIKPPPFKPLKEFKQPALPKTKKELKAEKEKLKGMIGKAAGGINKLKDAASQAQGLASKAQGLVSQAQGLAGNLSSQATNIAGKIQSQIPNLPK